MDSALDTVARGQHGLLTASQLRRAGWSDASIWRAVDAGKLVSFRHGVYRTAGAPITQDQAWLAAVLSGRSDAVLANLSAAEAWRFRGLPPAESIHLLTEGAVQPRLHGITGHRTIWLPDTDRTRVRAIPVTTPERTFVDVCGTVNEVSLGKIGDELLRRKTLVLPRLVRCFDEIPVSGRRKARPMKGFFVERVPGFDPGGSDRELDVMRELRRAGYLLPVQQYRVRVEGHTYVLDYAWPWVLQALESDGYEIHGTASAFHGDRERLRRLQRAGWQVWPITSRTSVNEILAIAQGATAQKSAA